MPYTDFIPSTDFLAMKLLPRWHHVSSLGSKFVERCEMLLPIKRINNKGSSLVKSTCITASGVRSSRPSKLYQQTAVHLSIKERSGSKQGDLFSAQLMACRDQNWWNNTENRVDDGSEHCSTDASVSQNVVEDDTSSKRSLSIREIRRRMNSDQKSTTSMESGLKTPLEFEPGLKFLDGIHGGWEDMEMFIE